MPGMEAAHEPQPRSRIELRARWLLVLILVISTSATVFAMRRTSTTFDEITPLAAGARGFHTGDWRMVQDFPPVMQYVYGLPVYLSGLNYPAETRTDTTPRRYQYAQQLMWQTGNDGYRLAFMARLVAVAFAAGLVLLVFFATHRSFGPLAAVVAAALVAFLPDVLAHGGIAYNDISLAPVFLAAVLAIDAALRAPAPGRGVLAGTLVSVALGIKHSALALGPIAVVLLLLELAAREGDRKQWLPRALATSFVAVAAGYLVQVAIYRGDFTLEHLRTSTIAAETLVMAGQGVPAYLLGEARQKAWWYFYPVSFMFKTPVALQALIIVALLGAMRHWAGRTGRSLLASRSRPYLVALVIFGVLLLRANIALGFRYALPVLPIVCILTAAGVAALWPTVGRFVRGAVVALILWSAASALSFYPHFIAYTSEHQPDPDRAYEVFVDSSLDWGQGLIELRDFMRTEGIPQIYLGYFGSALPEGYGIDYIPLPSFFPLPERPLPPDAPRFAAISATNLVGLYVGGDTYAGLREREPYRVLAHTIYVYELDE